MIILGLAADDLRVENFDFGCGFGCGTQAQCGRSRGEADRAEELPAIHRGFKFVLHVEDC
jgi:hypothetical protein